MNSRFFRVLRLDGGVMGAFSAALLAECERVAGRRIVEHFDLITGTSTGRIAAQRNEKPASPDLAMSLVVEPKQGGKTGRH